MNWTKSKREKIEISNQVEELVLHLESVGKTTQELKSYLVENAEKTKHKVIGNIISWHYTTKKRDWDLMINTDGGPSLFIYVSPSVKFGDYHSHISIMYKAINSELSYQILGPTNEFMDIVIESLDRLGAKKLCPATGV
jgi:hypothetical protein